MPGERDTFFTNREAKKVADHIGLKGRNYRVIDLSEELEERRYSGKPGKHHTGRTEGTASVFLKNHPCRKSALQRKGEEDVCGKPSIRSIRVV
jgi:hypothetical protein